MGSPDIMLYFVPVAFMEKIEANRHLVENSNRVADWEQFVAAVFPDVSPKDVEDYYVANVKHSLPNMSDEKMAMWRAGEVQRMIQEYFYVTKPSNLEPIEIGCEFVYMATDFDDVGVTRTELYDLCREPDDLDTFEILRKVFLSECFDHPDPDYSTYPFPFTSAWDCFMELIQPTEFAILKKNRKLVERFQSEIPQDRNLNWSVILDIISRDVDDVYLNCHATAT